MEPLKDHKENENFSVFNDTFRDAIRGNNNPSCGFINGNSCIINDFDLEYNRRIKGFYIYINIIIQMKVLIISMLHDNYTTLGSNRKKSKSNLVFGNYRKNIIISFNKCLVRQDLLGISIIFSSQGIPFIQYGSEFLRTKQGDHNSYKSNDEINSIKWSDKNKIY